MKRQPVLYTLKVWLWSVAVSPLIAAILQFYYKNANTSRMGWLWAYPLIVLFELLLTCLLWVLFWAITAIWSNLVRDDTLFRCAASITGLVIAAALCWLIVQDDRPSLGDEFFAMLLANCFSIFAGCWYFDIGKPLPNPIIPFNHQCYEHNNE